MQPQPYIVQVIEEPKQELNFGDVIVGAFGVTGALWHRRHPPEHSHLPSVTPAVPDSDVRRSSPAP
jgi:hypothetical protein